MLNRLRQGIIYVFGRYNGEKDKIVKEILSEDEFKIFDSMMEYDKVHSVRLLSFVKKNEILKDDILYWMLALLHDCGKGKTTFLKRMKKVVIGDRKLEGHTENAYGKLKKINKELAQLCRIHHDKSDDIKMKEFQKLDDK